MKTLEIQLAVYDAVEAVRRSGERKTLAKIGAELRLVPTAMPRVRDQIADAAHNKRNVMAATVSRHYKAATRIVANTARGQFPNSE